MGFLKFDTTILQFKFGSIEEKFYIYLIRKENKERFETDHIIGQVKLTRRTIAKDLEISENIARRLLKQFQDLGILIPYKLSPKTSKKPSVYMLKIYTKNHQDDNQDDNQDDTKINGLIPTVSEVEPPRNHQDNNQDDNPSIIDNIINNKNNNIVQSVAHECDLIWTIYPHKKGKARAYKKLPTLFKKYGYEQIKRCVERYSLEVQDKDKQYIKHGDTFFNGAYIDYLDANYIEPVKETGIDFETSEQIKKQAEKDLAAILGRV